MDEFEISLEGGENEEASSYFMAISKVLVDKPFNRCGVFGILRNLWPL